MTRKFQYKKGWLIAFSLLCTTSFAKPLSHQVVMPNCLKDKVQGQYKTLASNKSFSLLTIKQQELDNLAKQKVDANCGRFVDVSRLFIDKRNLNANAILNKYSQSPKHLKHSDYPISHQKEVNLALAKINPDNIWATLTHLSNYYNRSASDDLGVETAHWLKSQFDTMAKQYDRADVTSYFVDTGWFYQQPSVVTVIGKDLKGPAVIIGAHMDTLDGRMPGAGDDGSGSASVMEVARVLLSEKNQLTHPVYIIWYAAEERGLVGSGYVVDDFVNKNIPVKAVIQFDMTGFRNNQDDPTMYVYKDYVDPALTDFTSRLIKEYVKVRVGYSRCGYGCSDHASWTQEGFPSAFPCETDFPNHNPRIHSSEDRMEFLNLEHMTNFTKLGLAFAIEQGS